MKGHRHLTTGLSRAAVSSSKVALAVVAVVLALGAATVTASEANAAESCPNDALRSELRSGALPDCRAYELVSPEYKEGTFLISPFSVSPDGSHIIVGSLGTFAGSQNGELALLSQLTATAYEFSRGASGWTTAALAPPASSFTKQAGFSDASADLDRSVWLLRPVSQPEGVTNLYLEYPVGTFVEIGPATPDPGIANRALYRYVGGSADLSHVLFGTVQEEPSLLWPFDATAPGSSTLYEYVGTGHAEPSLVGVRGPAGSTELVSKCGTLLGSSTAEQGAGSMYNAISSTGSRVFFTAVGEDARECLGGGSSVEPPSDEIYAREELPEPDSGSPELRTVAISCPPGLSTPCADANFEGASRDGSSVFFTSTQKLLPGASEDTSGDTARSCVSTSGEGGCNLYRYDFGPVGDGLSLVSAGAPEPEGAQVQGVARISEDGTHVYFVAKGVLTGNQENSAGQDAEAGKDNLYLSTRDCPAAEVDCADPDEHLVFVATLSPEDGADWARGDDRPVLVSRDDRYLVFTSRADLTDEGTLPGVNQVFQYDSVTETLVRASIGQGGFNSDGRTPVYGAKLASDFDSDYSILASPAGQGSTLAPEDGAVFFQSPDALTPQALSDEVNPQDPSHTPIPNVYEYHDGNVSLLSDGRDIAVIDGEPADQLRATSASGEDVFFSTGDSLISQDTDTQQDVYDAHVNGGFPTPLLPSTCSGDTCQGPLSPAPQLTTPGSVTQQAEVNAAPPSVGPPLSKPKPLTRAQKLAKALASCRHQPTRLRSSCAARARRRYGRGTSTAKRSAKADRRS